VPYTGRVVDARVAQHGGVEETLLVRIGAGDGRGRREYRSGRGGESECGGGWDGAVAVASEAAGAAVGGGAATVRG
jgi:hypothetical protein